MDSTANANPFDVLSEPEVLLSEVKDEPTEEHSRLRPFTEEVQYEVEYLVESDKSSDLSFQEVSNDVVNIDCENSPVRCNLSDEGEIKFPSPPTKWKGTKQDDPDYYPTRHELNALEAPNCPIVSINSMTLKNYTRTINKRSCIFKDCALEDTEIIPDLVRIKLLKEHKLYVLKSSRACSIHIRDQNWEDLLLCTFKDFRASDIEDLIRLLRQATLAKFDFENIQLIPTRFLRFWMNVNKVQFKRIYDRFPDLQTLNLPKTSLSVYLMSLQKTDVERIALLLQFSEETVTDMVKSVQAIVHCETYEALNEVFMLEY